MKRDLKEIIQEINELSNETIIQNLYAEDYENWKNGNLTDEEYKTFEYLTTSSKKNAINFIIQKYKNIDNLIYPTDREYEIAYFKTFEQYFNIIKDIREKEKIDRELSAQTKAFFKRLSGPWTAR